MKLSASVIFSIVTAFVTTLVGYFVGIVIFPSLNNDYLYQVTIDIKILSLITCCVWFLVLLYVALHFREKKYSLWFWLAGISSAILFYYCTFKVYFPFENRNVIHAIKCDTTGQAKYLVGSQFTEAFKKQFPQSSQFTSEEIIYKSSCSPHLVWSPSTLESNYNKLISYYIICILLFISMLFLLLQAITAQLKIGPLSLQPSEKTS